METTNQGASTAPRPAGNQGNGGNYSPRPAAANGAGRTYPPRPAGTGYQGNRGPRPAGAPGSNGTSGSTGGYQGNRGTRPAGAPGSTGGYQGNRGPAGAPGSNGPSRFGGSSNGGSRFGSRPGQRDNRRGQKEEVKDNFTAEVITVRRVTRVVKGGKRMRFAALVVVGDGKGLIGFANKKGMDFQDAVAKATKKAKENVIKVCLTEDGTVPFATVTKFKAAQILLKPAPVGTSLIAGGYVRPVLNLVGVKNIYSKILGSNNKVVGVEAVIKALSNYTVARTPKAKVSKEAVAPSSNLEISSES
jgi:small subunit ribosomal protein S5